MIPMYRRPKKKVKILEVYGTEVTICENALVLRFRCRFKKPGWSQFNAEHFTTASLTASVSLWVVKPP